jgi:hypothetical protein
MVEEKKTKKAIRPKKGPIEKISPPAEMMGQRWRVRHHLSSNGSPGIIVSSIAAILQKADRLRRHDDRCAVAGRRGRIGQRVASEICTVVDDGTVRIVLKEPYAPLLDSLSQVYLGMALGTAAALFLLLRLVFRTKNLRNLCDGILFELKLHRFGFQQCRVLLDQRIFRLCKNSSMQN